MSRNVKSRSRYSLIDCFSSCWFRITLKTGCFPNYINAYRLDSANRQIGVCTFFAVIASQCAHWRGNPPVERNQITITLKNRGDSHFWGCHSAHFPTNRGIATTSVRTGLAMTGNLEQSDKHQFAGTLSETDMHVHLFLV